jgi:hypothetical protein
MVENPSDTSATLADNNASTALADNNKASDTAETTAGISRPPSPGFGDFAEPHDNKLAESHPQMNINANDGTLLQGALVLLVLFQD